MAAVTMWWAGTNWSSNAPALSLTPGPTGLMVSGSVDGPPSPILGLATRADAINVVAWYWLGTDRIPPSGCEWESRATDESMGGISGLTRGGIVPFGPWPNTAVWLTRRHRIFSDSTLIGDESTTETIMNIGDENDTFMGGLPRFGVLPLFSKNKFDFNRNRGLGIELSLTFRIFFRGDGRVTFSGVTLALPQFDIRSTL